MPSIAVEFPPGAVDMESLGSGVKENEREPLNPSADSHSPGDICSSKLIYYFCGQKQEGDGWRKKLETAEE